MSKFRYSPPSSGGTVRLEMSSELTRLFLGFIGTLSLSMLDGLDGAEEVRSEMSKLCTELYGFFGEDAWTQKGQELRFGSRESS